MATVTMSYNPDVPPPLPPARLPKAQQTTLQRRPLPEIPPETVSKQNQSGRPLPNIPTEGQKRPEAHHDRRFSLPHNQHISQTGGVKGNFSRHLSIDHQHSPMTPEHTHVKSVRQLNPLSIVPPKLPPRNSFDDISSHSHQRSNGVHRTTSPPVPPRLNSLENIRESNICNNTHEYETRFHFHPLDDLPEPEEFVHTKKTYLSRTKNKSLKETRKKLAEKELPAY